MNREKELKDRLIVLERNSHELKLVYQIHAKRYEDNKKELKEVREEIKKITSDIQITDHALLRYVQRFMKINIEELKKRILNKDVKDAINNGGGSGEFEIGGGFAIRVKNNVVVTIIDKNTYSDDFSISDVGHVIGRSLFSEILKEQTEVVNSPIRFNGVSVEKIKQAFEKFGFSTDIGF